MQESIRELAGHELLNRSPAQVLADLKNGGDGERMAKAEFASDAGKTQGKIMQDFMQRAAEQVAEWKLPRKTFETEAWHIGNGTAKTKKNDDLER